MPVLINLWSDGESDAEEERSNPANDDADDEAARAIDGLMHESTLHADGTQPAAIASTTAPVEPAVEPAAPRRLRQSTVKDSPNYSDDWRDQPLPGDEELGERVSSREAPPKLSRCRAATVGPRKRRRSGV